MTFSFLCDNFTQAIEVFHNFYETKKADQSFLTMPKTQRNYIRKIRQALRNLKILSFHP